MSQHIAGRSHPSGPSCGDAISAQCCPDPLSQVYWPRGDISSEEPGPIFLAPLARPEALATGLSRLIQCVVPVCSTSST